MENEEKKSLENLNVENKEVTENNIESSEVKEEIKIDDGSNIDFLKPEPPKIEVKEVKLEIPPEKSKEDDILFMEKPKRNYGGLISVLLILVVIVGGAYAYYSYILTPKNMVGNSIKYISKMFSPSTNELKRIDKEKVRFEGDMIVSNNAPGLEEFTDYSVDYNISYDLINNIANGKIDLKLGTEEMEIFAGVKNKKAYANVTNIFPRMLELSLDKDLKDYYDQFKIKKTNYSYLFKVVQKAMIKSFPYENATKGIEKETINKSEKYVLKTTLTFDQDAMIVIANEVKKAILNDENALGILSDLTDVEIDELKEDLKDTKAEDVEQETVYLTVCTDLINNKLLKAELRTIIKSETDTDVKLVMEVIDSKIISVSLDTNNEKNEEKNIFTLEYNTYTKKLEASSDGISDKDIIKISGSTAQERSDVLNNTLVIKYYPNKEETMESMVITINNKITTDENTEDFDIEGALPYEEWSTEEKELIEYILGNFTDTTSMLIQG